MSNTLFDIRTVEFYMNKNIFTGSIGDFNYRITPIENNFKVEVWIGELCYDKSEMKTQIELPLSQEGFEQVHVWLEEQYMNRNRY